MSETPTPTAESTFTPEVSPAPAEDRPQPAQPAAQADATEAEALPPALAALAAAGAPLRLRRLELYGFKSFCERTTLEIPDGITAIVGPNGCGKSNLGDALNWVLGEQSAKLLRGGSMQDVIFSGTDRRPPMGLAEVSLHLVTPGTEPGQDESIVITRRLFRSGESEYRLDGRRVRLKDIQEFLRAARVGAKTYATIEQGRIEQILNARPRDRRLILEDAAGIAGFKHKRRLAELKMEATQANLLRVQDVIAEVARQIRSLKRQAGRARRYRRLREQLREKERLHFALRGHELAQALREHGRRAAQARDAESEAAAGLARAEAALERERRELEFATQALSECAARLQAIEGRLQRAEERAAACRRRAEEGEGQAERYAAEAEALAARVARLEGELRRSGGEEPLGSGELDALEQERQALEERAGEIQRELAAAREALEAKRRALFSCVHALAERRNAASGAEETRARLEAQRARLDEEAGAVARRLAAAERHARELDAQARGLEARLQEAAQWEAKQAARRAELSERLEAARSAHGAAREAERSAAARLSTLEDLSARFADLSEGVRVLLREMPDAVRGVVADRLEVPQALEAPVEAYLAAWLPAVVLRDREALQRAVRHLRQRGGGQVHAAVEGAIRPRHVEIPDKLRRDRRVRGVLAEQVRSRDSHPLWVQLLGPALLVESFEAAVALAAEHPDLDFVTPAGDVVFAGGLVRVAGGTRGAGLLAHHRKVAEARQAHAAAERAMQQAERTLRERQEALETLDRETKAREAERAALRERARQVQLEQERLAAQREAVQRRLDVVREERAALEDELARLEEERRELAQAVAEAEGEQARLEAALRAAAEGVAEREAALREALERLASARERLAARREQREAALRARRSLEAALEAARRALQRAREESELARQQAAGARTELAQTEAQLKADLAERGSLQHELKAREQAVGERREALAGLERQIREWRQKLEVCREQLAEIEVDQARAEAARNHLDERCRQELGVPLEAAMESVPEEGSPEIERLAEEISELRQALARIGPVNMMAIEEFQELGQRYEFLTTQREDLQRSIESLKESIRRINRSSRQRFEEAFEQIRKNFQEIFQVLFRGGRADLRLEEGEDVLEAGVEIVAQPPGKRLTSVQLLSGGEKAMTAIALLFAIFRYQPSPFCLLDEVDAALDDANIGRFTRMLQEYSSDTQFILVTHNKLSMEVANVLYGVTMDEPGVSRVVSMELD